MKTILVVDDEYDICSALEMILTMEGYRVYLAYNGEDGLTSLARTPKPDLVMSDLMMPVLNGYDFVKGMRALPEHRQVPIVLSSAGPLDVSRLEPESWQAFVRKPYDLDRLLAKIEALTVMCAIVPENFVRT